MYLTNDASAKHNSTMERAMGLISSLLNVPLSQDVPFHQLQQLHSKHHAATFSLFVFLYFLLTTQGVNLR